jgi:RNA polymerase sigma-70 factor, ECF subfamily
MMLSCWAQIPGMSAIPRNELKRLVERALEMLGQRDKQVIELAAYEGLSLREIADITGETLLNVRQHYYRGLHKLRSVVERAAPDRE